MISAAFPRTISSYGYESRWPVPVRVAFLPKTDGYPFSSFRMKLTSKLLLTLSLAGNLGLFGYVISQRGSPSSAAGIGSGTSATPAAPGAAPSAGSEAWKALVAGDQPADWVQRLRAAGFPDNIVRAIVSAQIRERYAARRAALQKNDDAQYWSKSWNNWGGGDAASRAALRDLWRAERKEIKDALGDAYADSPEYQRMVQRQFGDLPKDKITALQTITEDYQELTSEIHQSANGVMLPEDREKLAFLEKEKRADLAAVLSPEELQAYELRSSQTASSLRWQLGAFAPSEQEFRSIFALQREFDLQFSNDRRSSNDEAVQKARSDAQTALDAQIKAGIGEARYADYQRAKDHNYQQLAGITERLALPKENAVAVYDLSKDIQKRAQEIRGDKDLKGDARNEALAALVDEANTKIVASLGERGAEAYKENGGWWLRNIAPPRQTKK